MPGKVINQKNVENMDRPPNPPSIGIAGGSLHLVPAFRIARILS